MAPARVWGLRSCAPGSRQDAGALWGICQGSQVSQRWDRGSPSRSCPPGAMSAPGYHVSGSTHRECRDLSSLLGKMGNESGPPTDGGGRRDPSGTEWAVFAAGNEESAAESYTLSRVVGPRVEGDSGTPGLSRGAAPARGLWAGSWLGPGGSHTDTLTSGDYWRVNLGCPFPSLSHLLPLKS